jgi:hypothetical protein
MQAAEKKGVLVLFVGGRQQERNLNGGLTCTGGGTEYSQPCQPNKREVPCRAAGAHGFLPVEPNLALGVVGPDPSVRGRLHYLTYSRYLLARSWQQLLPGRLGPNCPRGSLLG